MKKKEFTSFGQWKKYENRKKEVNEASWFGLILGLILLAVCGFQTICSEGIVKTLFTIPTVIGLILFVLGGFSAPTLIPLTKCVRKIANVVGTFILRIILLPIYLILFIFSLFGKKSNAEKYEFYSWDSYDKTPQTQFLPYEQTQSKPHRSSLLGGTLNSIFFVFTKNKQYFLIPLVVILLILGLVFFFLSSSSVFAFVYTLF